MGEGQNGAESNLREDEKVDCLRGRLLAERMASRSAKEEADKLGNRMVELEKLVEEEAKSRKEVEKRLKRLMKKMEMINNSSSSSSSSCNTATSTSESEQSWCKTESESVSSLQHQNGDEDEEDEVDNSMALVLVQQEVQENSVDDNRIDSEVLDKTVKQVLDALSYAKHHLRRSMESRRRRCPDINIIKAVSTSESEDLVLPINASM